MLDEVFLKMLLLIFYVDVLKRAPMLAFKNSMIIPDTLKSSNI